jgi:Tripartite tricarboxylate transporter TctB family
MIEEREAPPARRADLWSGLLFAGLGAVSLWVGADYSLGVPSRIGPGYVPRLLGILMAGLGAFLVVRSAWTRESIDTTVAWRPLALVLGSVVAFALVFEASGLVPAILVSVAIGNFAMPENRWTTAVVLGALLAFFAWALFVKALSLPLPVWFK